MRVELSTENVDIKVRETQDIDVTITPVDESPVFSITFDEEGIVDYDVNGTRITLTAQSTGNTTMHVTYKDVTKDVTINVTEDIKMELSKENVILKTGNGDAVDVTITPFDPEPDLKITFDTSNIVDYTIDLEGIQDYGARINLTTKMLGNTIMHVNYKDVTKDVVINVIPNAQFVRGEGGYVDFERFIPHVPHPEENQQNLSITFLETAPCKMDFEIVNNNIAEVSENSFEELTITALEEGSTSLKMSYEGILVDEIEIDVNPNRYIFKVNAYIADYQDDFQNADFMSVTSDSIIERSQDSCDLVLKLEYFPKRARENGHDIVRDSLVINEDTRLFPEYEELYTYDEGVSYIRLYNREPRDRTLFATKTKIHYYSDYRKKELYEFFVNLTQTATVTDFNIANNSQNYGNINSSGNIFANIGYQLLSDVSENFKGATMYITSDDEEIKDFFGISTCYQENGLDTISGDVLVDKSIITSKDNDDKYFKVHNFTLHSLHNEIEKNTTLRVVKFSFDESIINSKDNSATVRIYFDEFIKNLINNDVEKIILDDTFTNYFSFENKSLNDNYFEFTIKNKNASESHAIVSAYIELENYQRISTSLIITLSEN